MPTLQSVAKKYAYPGSNKLYRLAIEEGLDVTTREVDDFIKGRAVYQIHRRPGKRETVGSAIVAPASNTYYQIDLLDMTGYRGNRNFNWILLVVDIFDRRLAADGVRSKSAAAVLPVLQECIAELGEKPLIITSDLGGEFRGAVDQWLEQQGIKHLGARVGDHNVLGVVDRVSRTIKEKIHRMFTENHNAKWMSELQDIVDGYNHEPHVGLYGLTPVEAHEYPALTVETHLMRLKKAEKRSRVGTFKAGDVVRVRLQRTRLEKGYTAQYSTKTFRIVGRRGNYFDLSDGRIFRGPQLRLAH